MHLSNDQRSFARHLRQQQTDAERRLWSRLRSNRLLGCKFRRQHPIGPYFADFACLEIGLVVELDGGQHAAERGKLHDGMRSDVIAGYGLEVVRFWDNDVLRDTDAVILAIARKIEALTRAAPTLTRPAGDLSR
jgi:very-short-patch-repair endonuclease